MLLPSPVGIRDADRPEQRFLPLDDHTEYGNGTSAQKAQSRSRVSAKMRVGSYPGSSLGGVCNFGCCFSEAFPRQGTVFGPNHA
jgi:hypothetical protein